jgi:hypothetical protein
MDDQRLTEIEATTHSPAYRDEADMIGVDELIAEVHRLRTLLDLFESRCQCALCTTA